MLGHELRERDEYANLEGHLTAILHSVPMNMEPMNTNRDVREMYAQEQVCISQREVFYPVEPERNDIGEGDGDDDEFNGLYAAPDTLQVAQ